MFHNKFQLHTPIVLLRFVGMNSIYFFGFVGVGFVGVGFVFGVGFVGVGFVGGVIASGFA